MKLVANANLLSPDFDVVVFVNDTVNGLKSVYAHIEDALLSYQKVNPTLIEGVNVVPFAQHPHKRLIFSPTDKLNTDIADSRNIYDAGVAGLRKAVKLGCRKPLLILGPIKSAPDEIEWSQGDFPLLNAILGALHGLYKTLELTEAGRGEASKYDKLGVFGATDHLLQTAWAIEEGKRVARDIGGSDPERMAAPRIVEYLKNEFADCPDVHMKFDEVDPQKYPLMAAVDRCASGIDRHKGKVVHLEYKGNGNVDTSLFIVGKGITYDTGGADVKAGGCMAGMHRDKSGAAAVAGLFKTLSLLKPEGLNVSGYLALVRNSIGSDAYLSDEIITARSGCRVRIGNTDAEGRMVMTDLLCEAKDKAKHAVNPFLFTFATLTGHVIRAYKCYTAVMDNGPARKQKVAQQLKKAGDQVSDMAEISTVRREDYEINKPNCESEDIIQCNNLPSTMTPRGHQLPAAFMVVASGLDKHGLDSDCPIPYTHCDVAGSAGEIGTQPTGAPLAMFVNMFVMPRLK